MGRHAFVHQVVHDILQRHSKDAGSGSLLSMLIVLLLLHFTGRAGLVWMITTTAGASVCWPRAWLHLAAVRVTLRKTSSACRALQSPHQSPNRPPLHRMPPRPGAARLLCRHLTSLHRCSAAESSTSRLPSLFHHRWQAWLALQDQLSWHLKRS